VAAGGAIALSHMLGSFAATALGFYTLKGFK